MSNNNGRVRIAVLLAVLAAAGWAGAQEDAKKPKQEFDVLFVTVDVERGKQFAKLFKSAGISCTVTGYDKVSAATVEEHDLVIADTPEVPAWKSKQMLAHRSVVRENFPVTRRPVLGIGYLGYMALGKHGVALGKVFT
ncbi:MAG: hypothetical protein ACYTAF_07195 [Planctomycetota bacterium]|jgi:hypothetical protein